VKKFSLLIASVVSLLLVFLLLAACHRPRPATIPLRVLHHDRPPGSTLAGRPPRDLVVFLPGRGDLPEDFERQGLLALAREAGLDADVLAVDSHLGYYVDRSIVIRLHDDVIAPARARGYERIWLAGISLGALGSILYMQEHPGDVAGAVLIAPYLGEKPLLDEIEKAGGLRAWRPAAFSGGDYQRETWKWLQAHYANPPGTPAGTLAAAPPLWLGYGEKDRYRQGDRLLAAVLPPERVFTAPGGHAWKAWRAVWRKLLEAGALPAIPAPPAIPGRAAR
jgi:pimeloyl-ACP methyl ester carboxylesterase